MLLKVIYTLKESEFNLETMLNDKIYNLNGLKSVLKGITDVVGVFDLNKRILFSNDAGYNFYKKTQDEIIGKTCFEVLNKKETCKDCGIEQAIKTKQMVKLKKYVPELDKFMECTYNPVLNNLNEVIFVVAHLKNITQMKILVNTLKESEERYRNIVDLSPEAIVITVDSKIVLANHQCCRLLGINYSKVIGENIYKYIDPQFLTMAHRRIKKVLGEKKLNSTSDYRILRYDSSLVEVEVSASYLTYKGKPAIQAVIRNITEMKRSLNEAAKFQKKYIENESPFPERIEMESLYMPARTVSGDFFKIYKINEYLTIGIVGDVSGKGIRAALNVSAFFVLFREAILTSHDPSQIVKFLNKKTVDYLGDNHYIAACCFSLNFKENQAKIVSAGINQFMFQKNKSTAQELIVKGPFLGMFEDGVFDEQILHFEEGDRFYFPTDGLDFIFNDNELKENYLKSHTIAEFIIYLKNTLNNIINDIGGLKDDSTIITLEIK